MSAEVYVALITSTAMILSNLLTNLVNSRLTNYKIDELQKKVEKHNNVIERVALLERDVEVQNRELAEIREVVLRNE